MDSITDKDWRDAEDRAHGIVISRSTARKWIYLDLPDELISALDNAQGDAEEEAQFIFIKVRPGAL